MDHPMLISNHVTTARRCSLLGYLALAGLALTGCASPAAMESDDQALTENVTVTTLDGGEIEVALRFSDTDFDTLEAIATVEGFDYVLSAASDSKGASALVGSMEDPSVYMEAFEAGELSELSVVAGNEAWHSAEDSGEEFERIALAEPHVRRMMLATQALEETASTPKCGPPCIAGWGLFVAGVAAYGTFCASEKRVRPLEFHCTQSADGTEDCRVRENPDECHVSSCDKCRGVCLQNC